MEKTKRDSIKKTVRTKVKELDELVLDRLYEEWSMVQARNSGGDEISVHPRRLITWFDKLQLSREQLFASLNRLRENGLILNYEYVDADTDEYDEFSDWLKIAYPRDFEEKYWAQETKLKHEVSDADMWAKAATTKNTLHLYIKEPKSAEKTHLIVDHDGQIRFDKSDKAPGEVLSEIDVKLITREGKEIRANFRFE